MLALLLSGCVSGGNPSLGPDGYCEVTTESASVRSGDVVAGDIVFTNEGCKLDERFLCGESVDGKFREEDC